MYTNACSLPGKMDELRNLVYTENFDVIAVTETWVNEEITDAELALDGYVLFRNDRKKGVHTKGGGVALYIKDIFKSRECCKLTNSNFEDSIWCFINFQDVKLLVGTCYRSTSSTDLNNNHLLALLKEAVKESQNSQLLLIGDFNYPEINFEDNDVSAGEGSAPDKFFTCVQDLFLYQHVTECTRYRGNQKPSTLDYVFTYDENSVSDMLYKAPLGKSDHCCIQFEYTIKSKSEELPDTFKLNFWKGDYQSMNEDLKLVDWESLFSGKNVEEMWSSFKDKLLDTSLTHIPSRSTVKQKSKKRNWMTKATVKLIRKREEAWHKYKSMCSTQNYAVYKRVRNKVTTAIRNDKEKFQLRLVKSFKANPKRFYGYVRSKQTVKATISSLLKEDGSPTKSDTESAELLCRQFQEVFTREPDKPTLPNNNRSILNIQFDGVTVMKKLKRLKPEKSPGPDGIHPMVLQNTAEVVADPLARIFQESYSQGVLPADWKKANIAPIFKKGSRTDANNYRPVSLTSIPCKIMESIIKDAVLSYIESNDLITEHQHGFVSGRSCLTNLLEVLEAWTRVLDSGYGVDVIYLDYKKAFDTVPHRRLLQKLSMFGIDDSTLKWIMSFLEDRHMRVTVRGSCSHWVEVISGVPQGSVLGPLLFLIYVNDLPGWIKTNIKMFADDTKLWNTIQHESDSQEMQEDLDTLREWSNKWLLDFNIEKCKVMHVGHKVATSYSISRADGTLCRLAEADEEKDLGVILTNDLKAGRQCREAARKAMNVLRTIKRHFTRLDKPTFLILYKSYVRPLLEYSIQAWSPCLRKDINCLEQVQRRATKLVVGLKRLEYADRLNELGLTTLEKRRVRGDLIETFKIVTGRERVKMEDFFECSRSNYNLRGHQFKMTVQRSRTTTRSSFFSQRVVNIWNGLPRTVVSASSVNNFKNRLDDCAEWGI